MMTRKWQELAVAAVLLMSTALAGCTDPTVAPKSTVTQANIFTDPNSYQQFLAKIYAGLIVTGQQGPAGNADIAGIDEGFGEYLRLYWYLQEMPTDEAVIGWNDPGLPDLNTGLWGADNSMINAMYYRVFYQVMLVNEFLRQSVDDSLDARGQSNLLDAVHQYRAEARFMRALSYWHGIDLFADIPLVTEADQLGATPPMQATRDSIFNYVVSEVEDIRDQLPAKGAGSYGRATPAAADMLLAELYLNAEVYTGTAHWDEALAAAQRVIGAGYSLDPNYRRVFGADNNTSPELIFVAPQDGGHTQTWGGMTFLVHAGCGGSMSSATYGIDYCWGGYRLKQQAYRLFGAGDGRAAYFWTDGQTDSVIAIGDFKYGIGAPKFTNLVSTGGHGAQLGMVDTDFPVFRSAEAYLIWAEAALRGASGGSRATALNYVNLVRERAYGGASGDITDAELTLQFILDERGRELLYETRRRADLIRFGQFTGSTYLWAWKGGTAGGTSLEACKSIYPLPANEVIANPNLSGGNGGC